MRAIFLVVVVLVAATRLVRAALGIEIGRV
jgi:hypothetical protein